MRIPISQGPRVNARPVGTPYDRGDTRSGLEHVSQGLENLGRATDSLGKQIVGLAQDQQRDTARAAAAQQEIELKAHQRANAVRANNKVTQLQSEITAQWYGDVRARERTAGINAQHGDAVDADYEKQLFGDTRDEGIGILNMRGEAAVGGTSKALEWAEKRRAELASDLNEEQKALFLQHSAPLLETARKQAENHASDQFRVAQETSVKARADVSLKAIAAAGVGPAADEAVVTLSLEAERAIRGLALSDEDAEAKAQAWRGEVAMARLNVMLARGEWQEAEKVFATSKGVLGKQTDEYEKRIGAQRKATEAVTFAQGAVEQSRGKNGRVSIETALKKADEAIKDPDTLKAARAEIHDRARVAEQMWDRETEEISTQAEAIYNKGGWAGVLKSGLADKLNERNPRLYGNLRDQAEQKYKAHKAGKEASNREQADRNRIARNEFLSLPAEERAQTDLATFLAGKGVDQVGASVLGVDQRKAKDSVDKGEQTHETEFVRQAVGEGIGRVTGKADQKAYEGVARRLFQQLRDEKGKPPTREEAKKAIADLHLQQIQEGFLFDSKVPAWKVEADRHKKREALGVVDGGGSAGSTQQAERKGSAPAAEAKVAVPSAARKQVNPKTGEVRYLDANGNVIR